MKVKELTKEIYDKYPKVWEKLKEKHDKKSSYKYFSTISYDFSCEQIRYLVSLDDCLKIVPFSFSRLYGLLEDFFEENGIIIRYRYFERTGFHSYIIYNKKEGKIINSDDRYTDYRYCQAQAILKACEIFNERLK